jgi:hypothetical protein
MNDESTSAVTAESERLTSPGPTNSEPAADAEPSNSHKHRRHGKIAQLPKSVRDQLNRLLEDGVPYREILLQLGEHGLGLNEQNLSRWKDGGHQDWLLQQYWQAETRARQEVAADLTQDFDATQVNHAALQLATLHIFQALRDLRSGGLDEKLGGDSAAFARLINALSRASRETLELQKYRDACASARAAMQPLRDPSRQLTQSETRAIVRNVDKILGLSDDDESIAAAVKYGGGTIRLHHNATTTPGDHEAKEPPDEEPSDLPSHQSAS